MIERVKKITERITMECLGVKFILRVDYDNVYKYKTVQNTHKINISYNKDIKKNKISSSDFNQTTKDVGRIFLQVIYKAPCTKTGDINEWSGRKYYLSDYMTDDEIVKTAYVAFESAIKHEIMEGFKVDGIILFNPHINFEELLKISHKEVKRD